MTEREDISLTPGEAMNAYLVVMLLGNKNVHDINDKDILQAGVVVAKVVRGIRDRRADAVT